MIMLSESCSFRQKLLWGWLFASSLAASPVIAEVVPNHAGLHEVSFKQSRTVDWHAKEGMFYKRNWGVDIIGVKVVSSGWMLRFDYRVLDVKMAKPIFDKMAKPYLIDDGSGARLSVPNMENIGNLRQTPEPVANRIYYTIFGNPGKLVKRGSNVSVVIGNFRADGLTVE
jgi:hypothetical protein